MQHIQIKIKRKLMIASFSGKLMYTYINVPPTLSNSDLPLKSTNMKKLKPKEREKVHIFGANFKMDVTFLEVLSDHIFYVQIMST